MSIQNNNIIEGIIMFKTTVKDIVKTKTAALDVFNKTIVKLGAVKLQLEESITNSEISIGKLQQDIAVEKSEIEAAEVEIKNIDNVVGKITQILN